MEGTVSYYVDTGCTAVPQPSQCVSWYRRWPSVSCRYLYICSDADSWLCHSCTHNTSKSFYEPEDKPRPKKRYPRWLEPYYDEPHFIIRTNDAML